MNRLAFSSASFVVLLALPAAAAAGPVLQAHRAYYDLELRRLDTGNNMTSVAGKLAYEIRGSQCAGYSINYRFANRINYTEGGAQVVDNQMTSWESGDGLELDISQKQFVDSQLRSDNRIKVSKDKENEAGKGLITASDTKEFAIGPEAIFPTRYQLKLIDAAIKGEKRDVSTVYEGSDDDKAMRVVTFIGDRRLADGLPAGSSASLAQLAGWPVSMAYYPENAQADEQPAYQADFLMLENGISTNLLLDYGSYALYGKLTKLDLLPSDKCP